MEKQGLTSTLLGTAELSRPLCGGNLTNGTTAEFVLILWRNKEMNIWGRQGHLPPWGKQKHNEELI